MCSARTVSVGSPPSGDPACVAVVCRLSMRAARVQAVLARAEFATLSDAVRWARAREREYVGRRRLRIAATVYLPPAIGWSIGLEGLTGVLAQGIAAEPGLTSNM